MIGLLIDSQKGPVMPATNKVNTPWSSKDSPDSKQPEKKSFWKDSLHLKSLTKHTGHQPHECVIKQIDVRLNNLEERITIQEEKAVTRDYFKSIIAKLLMSQKQASSVENKRDTCIQCGSALTSRNPHYCQKEASSSKFYKHYDDRSLRRQDKYHKINYLVNPAFVKENIKNKYGVEEDSLDAELLNAIRSKAENMAESKIDKIEEVDEILEDTRTIKVNPKETIKTKESDGGLWRWGEEKIKPGFDLKKKIMSLMEEKLQCIKPTKPRQYDTSKSVPPTTRVCIEIEKNRNTYPVESDRNKYSIDIKRALDDSTFKKNIEACKEKTNWKYDFDR